ncbi:DUF4959 domain-containing protein [Sinomicrobium sp. 2019215]|nr:DUF4959 domain-containing protein [Sinomicrobium weinanense]MBU3122633.1 DUF4959 domain-containing protein [Sinomicrobium weinanense]
MKNIHFYCLLLCFVVCTSCDDDIRRPLVADDIPPGQVTDIEIKSISGGADITYALPGDDDILYVVARFQRTTGEMASVKSSVYNNSLTVEGFGDTNEYQVQLFTVDQSENESEPVDVVIKPKTPPIQLIRESLSMEADFGGMHLYWENEAEAPVSLIVLTDNEIGQTEQIEVRYSSRKEDDFAVRGYDTIPRSFSVFIRDRYDNISEVKETTVSPLFEQLLDKNLHAPMSLPHDAPDAFGWVMSNLFNDDIGSGFHTPQGWKDDDPLPTYEGQDPHFFTFDLGVTAKLSRLKFWQRQGSWIYFHGNPRYYEIWGTDQLNSDGSFDGWTKLVENGEVIKPSGQPLQQNSSEDVDAAARGEEATIISSAPPVRFIRFVNLQSWAGPGTTYLHIMEVEVYGQVVE